MYPKAILNLIEHFKRLPSIGEKSAERMVLFLATQVLEDDLISFGNELKELKQNIKYCQICGSITDKDICDICSNTSRESAIVMVVSDSKDVVALEKIGLYQGRYHVLGGLIDFSRGVTEKDLNIDGLISRTKDLKEVIIATSSTVEGELTAKFIKALLEIENIDILVTRLAYGLPVGTDLKYADQLTLSKAVENRQKY